MSVGDHAQKAYIEKKETCIGPCPTLRQNRTEHTPIDRGVYERERGKTCSQLMISTDLQLRVIEKKIIEKKHEKDDGAASN